MYFSEPDDQGNIYKKFQWRQGAKKFFRVFEISVERYFLKFPQEIKAVLMYAWDSLLGLKSRWMKTFKARKWARKLDHGSFLKVFISSKRTKKTILQKDTIFSVYLVCLKVKKDLLSCCRVETCCILLRLSLLDFSALSSPNAAISRSTLAIYIKKRFWNLC